MFPFFSGFSPPQSQHIGINDEPLWKQRRCPLPRTRNSYCTIGAKDPPKPAVPIVRCFPKFSSRKAGILSDKKTHFSGGNRMENKPGIDERLRRAAEQMWLQYFNNCLLKQSLITPDQHRQMKSRILARRPSREHTTFS